MEYIDLKDDLNLYSTDVSHRILIDGNRFPQLIDADDHMTCSNRDLLQQFPMRIDRFFIE